MERSFDSFIAFTLGLQSKGKNRFSLFRNLPTRHSRELIVDYYHHKINKICQQIIIKAPFSSFNHETGLLGCRYPQIHAKPDLSPIASPVFLMHVPSASVGLLCGASFCQPPEMFRKCLTEDFYFSNHTICNYR
jgi:hypothetical protein